MSTTVKIFAERLENKTWTIINNSQDKQETEDLEEAIYIGQNYPLFAVLAGVRAGRYNESYKTNIKPISRPRGLPKDVSSSIRSYFLERNYHHSISWFIVEELLNFQWTKHRITKWGRVETQFANLFSGYSYFPQDFPSEAKIYSVDFVPEKLDTVEVSWIENYQQFVCSEYDCTYDELITDLLSLGMPKKNQNYLWFC